VRIEYFCACVIMQNPTPRFSGWNCCTIQLNDKEHASFGSIRALRLSQTAPKKGPLKGSSPKCIKRGELTAVDRKKMKAWVKTLRKNNTKPNYMQLAKRWMESEMKRLDDL